MSGFLISCCNTGPGSAPFFVAHYDIARDAYSWLKLDNVDQDLSRVAGATGLCSGPEGYFIGLQGALPGGRILHFNPDFSFNRTIVVPGIKDIHSIHLYDGNLLIASTGTNEFYCVPLDNPGEARVHFHLPAAEKVENFHFNDYVRFGGKEYVLGHSNPFSHQPKRNGFVYCITDGQVALEKLEHPHTFLVLEGRLAVLDSARGMVVFVEDGLTAPWHAAAGGGVVRGACQIGDRLYLASSSRRLYSRKQGLLQINVADNEKIFGEERFMAWLHRVDMGSRQEDWRKSFSEIGFEIYDLLALETPPPPERLLENAAAIRAQSFRQQLFDHHRREAAQEDVPERLNRRAAAMQAAPPVAPPAPMGRKPGIISDPMLAPEADPPNFEVARASGSRKTIVAFAGLAQLIGGLPPFNFMASLKGVDANVIFVRDPHRTWYNGPIEGLGRNSAQIGRRIAELVGETGSHELYLLGTSSGGFAALAFAATLKAKRVLAFGPQTNIDTQYLRGLGETRWLKLLDRMKNPQLVDTLPLIQQNPSIRYDLVVGSRAQLDVVYAERLAGVGGLNIHYVDAQHNSAKYLKDHGKLEQTLRNFVSDAALDI